MTKTELNAIAKRKQEAARILGNNSKSDGKAGCAFELLMTNYHGNVNKVTVSPAGKPDFYISDGKVSRLCECKTNGGAIDCLELAEKTGKWNAFFVYGFDICNKNSHYERWTVEPKIFTYGEFIDLLYAVGGWKYKDGKSNPTTKIQCNTKKWYQAIQTHGIPYNPEKRYTIIDKKVVPVD